MRMNLYKKAEEERNTEKRPEPKANQIYKHFKGNVYKILGVAVHTENSERLVVYQSVESPEKVFARPIDMFMSEIDRFRYPMIRAKYRFTLIEDVIDDEGKDETQNETQDENTNEALSESLDESEYEKDIESESAELQEVKEEELIIPEMKAEEETETEENESEASETEEPESEEQESTETEKNAEEKSSEVTDDNAIYKEDGTLVLDPIVEAILDEKDFTKKIENFERLRGKCTDEMLTTLAISLDIQVNGDTAEEKYADILKTLRMHEKYETSRLR